MNLEVPAPDLTGAQGVNFSPDFIARQKFQPGRKRGLALYTEHIQAALVVRQLRGEVSGQPEVKLATGGIGGNVSASSCHDGMRTTASSCSQRRIRDRTLHR